MPPSHHTDDGPAVGNYLYLSSTQPGVAHSCFESFDSIAPGETDLVVITKSLQETMESWQAVHDDPPANISVVGVGEETRSAAGQPQASGSPRSGTIWPVPHPGDLTGLAIAITEILSQRSAGAGRLIVCFEALDAVLQYASVKPTFRFLHEVTTQLRQAGAVAHYHVADFQVEGQRIDPFESLFDDVIETDACVPDDRPASSLSGSSTSE